MALAQWEYDRHSIFDRSLTDTRYYYSAGSSRPPSSLALVDGKLPVDSAHSLNGTRILSFAWRSMQGGNWEVAVRTSRWRNREIDFSGDMLSLWCFSESAIPADALPALFLEDVRRNRTGRVAMGSAVDGLAPNSWTRVRVPLRSFPNSGGAQGAADRVNLHRIRAVHFAQSDARAEGGSHRMLVASIDVDSGVAASAHEASVPLAPRNLSARGFERHVDLQWQPAGDQIVRFYRVYRSRDGRTFSPVGIQRPSITRYADYLGGEQTPVYYKVCAVGPEYDESPPAGPVEASTRPMTDEEMLTMVQEASCRYYWEAGHPVAGLALENIPGDPNLVATGASGFGIMALLVGMERGFIDRNAGEERLLQSVRFLEQADRFHGAWAHFMDGRTGKAIPLFGKYDDGGDLVETAFLIQGLLAARSYMTGASERAREIRETITRLWEGVEWDWYRRTPESNFLLWHWSPDYAWHIDHPLVGWNETMIVYLLAVASPTHPVPPALYETGWAGQSERAVQYRRNWGKTNEGDHYANGNTYYGVKLDVGVGSGGPLFFTHYSFMGFDPHGKRDRFTEYFSNNRNLARINHAYCAANPGRFAGYSDSCWGLTASDDPWGYHAHDPAQRNDNGTMTPTGALASFPYTPEESMKALKHFYREHGRELWGAYGFRDAFNETEHWVADIYMGLNQAPITVMIENYRTALVWKLFMANPEIQTMVTRIGFVNGR